MRDLEWLGLDWDWETAPQSQRTAVYDQYFQKLMDEKRLYPCYCTRTQLHSVNAPHASDGTYIYPGTCRNLQAPPPDRTPSWRLRVPQGLRTVEDRLQGIYREDLAMDCGDFVVRRSDGMYVYQLAVTVDDGEAGVTQVVRGLDLLSSAPRQMYLQELFGFAHPEYAHVPLLLAPDGRRLSKRDRDMDLGYLQAHYTPQELIGKLAFAAGLLDTPTPICTKELIDQFAWHRLRKNSIVFSLD